MGGTFNFIDRKENVLQSIYQNQEMTTGIFTEYAHTFSKKVNAVLGVRTDYHNLYGVYFTPRFHIRYAPIDQLSFRASVGKAYRTATVFSENLGLFSTNRTVLLMPSQNNGVYGLQNEKAWNGGVNATYKFKFNYRTGSISADYYYTRFMNQVVVDWEESSFIKFYNSTQKSFANSFQIQLDYQPIRKMDVRIAYRIHDVQVTYENKLMQKPLNAKHRAFINLSYTTKNKWSFDYTLQYIGPKRIPSTKNNPIDLQFATTSPAYITMNAHLNKVLKRGLEVYAGGENLLNYMQQVSIIEGNNPFGQYFDGSLIWGPTMGRNFYVGIRYKN
jgi:outer membrane receptor protein involved in Fe transport